MTPNHTVVTPWPPQQNGIADYAFELARHGAAPLTVVTRALEPALPPPRGVAGPVRVMSDLDPQAARHLARGRNIFHIGNNPDHAFLIPLFLAHGGVAVIHDASLHYLAECADGVLPGFFAAHLAEEHPRIAQELLRLWRLPEMKRAIDYQEVRMLSWLRGARAVIVHSRSAARIVGPWLPDVPIHVVPHFAYPDPITPDLFDREASVARTRLDIAADRFVVATLGFATANKQYEAVLRAMLLLPEPLRRRITYLIGGAVRPLEYDLPGRIAALGLQDQVIVTGYLTAERMRDVLVASDLICNLRYPTFGESSGTLARAIGLGCGIVVSDTGAYGELPENICLRVPAKPDPSRDLAALFGAIMDDPAALRRRRHAAHAYARRELAPAQMAARYETIVDFECRRGERAAGVPANG
jgi:glycosyltransferase involved in cell wall biosynthesis